MNQPTTIQCHIHGEVQFSSTSDLGSEIVTRYCPLCAKAMQNTVPRICDECGNPFEVREDIAVDMDALKEQCGDPYVCGVCLPQDPYEDRSIEHEDDTDGDHASWLCATCGDPAYDCGCADEESLDLEGDIDRTAERFPDGNDPMMYHLIEARCQKCDVEFEVEAGKPAWCPSCHAEQAKE